MVFIGNQTSCWASSPTAPFDYAVAEHFDAFEWFPDKKPQAGWDENDLDTGTRKKIADTARDRGMRVSVHARWQVNPLLPNRGDLLAKDIQLARDLGAVLLNIHLFAEQGLPAFVQAITPLLGQTSEAGLQLSIENTPHHSPEQFNELFGRLRATGALTNNHVGMCLDIGHANLASATLNDFLAFVDRLEVHVPILHLHLHENWGDADSHLPLFTGPSARDDSGIRGLVDRLKRRNFSGSIILEQWPHPASLLKTARDRLLAMWGPKTGLQAPPAPEPAQPATPAQQKPGSPGTQRARGPAAGPVPQGKTTTDPEDDAVEAHGTGGAPVAAHDLESDLVAGNQRARSWREKLEFVSQLLSDNHTALTTNGLVEIAIYLRFLGTGQITCVEDGRHFRPAHHARLASDIYQRLAQTVTSENRFVLRKIYPFLPSFASEFQRAEPLTRIRDIAHRNDIDSELKREIKTTLQNKLHRCAGPEDLETSAALLERINANKARYSPEFVEQFKLFHQELKEFFNAGSLDERLTALKPSLQPEQIALVDSLLQQKAAPRPEDRMAALRSLTQLRRTLTEHETERRGAEGQSFTLADISLEDFAFVLVSQIISDGQPPENSVFSESHGEAFVLAVENLALGGIETEESRAVASELQAWLKTASPERFSILRLRASLLRGRRLAEQFSARVIGLFGARAERLGRAMGVEEHAVRVFCEADIRSHLVFQVSKLADDLLRQTRRQLGLPPWDVLVPGRATGRAVSRESLNASQTPSPGDTHSPNYGRTQVTEGPVIIFLDKANGDEEIPNELAGIVLAHELAHLSHLAVRARQARIVLVTCEDPKEFADVKNLANHTVTLTATAEHVTCEKVTQTTTPLTRSAAEPVKLPQITLSPGRPWIALEEATVKNSGGKADGGRRLTELSQQSDAGFGTPAGLVVPFGVMETALEQALDLCKEYWDLARKLDRMQPKEFESSAARLREIIFSLKLPPGISSEVDRRFTSALIVRSSANGEDLPQFAGAGLYESVINVSPANVDRAIREVWGSLWTARAVQSRRSARVPQDQAHMAVLVQELVNPEFSFVLHTTNPLTSNDRELTAEIVVGLGETLVSGTAAGTPYRLRCAKNSDKIETLAFANFSQAIRPATDQGLARETLDYSQIALSLKPTKLEELGRRLSAVGTFIERAFGAPQDIEGAVVSDRIYVVQARSQQGLTKT